LGFLTKSFDRVDNFKNNAIGSHINAFINFRLLNEWNVGKNYKLQSGLSLTHFSNGAFKMPNLGVNVPTIFLGLSKSFNYDKMAYVPDTCSSLKKHWNISIIAGSCVTETEPPVGIKYFAGTFGVQLERYFNNKGMWLIGAEIGYNGGNKQRLTGDSIFITKKSELVQTGIKAGYSFTIGNLHLPVEMGYYTTTLYKGNGPFFHRIGMRYYFANNFIANITLKTHWAKADYIEFGIGYRFL
jgi:hypothetical protein